MRDRATAPPETGGQFPSSASVWMGTVPREGLVPNQRGVWRGDRIRQKEEVMVLAEEKLRIYHFQNQQLPLPCILEFPSSCRKVVLSSASGLWLHAGVPGPGTPGRGPVSGGAASSLVVCRPSKGRGCFCS